MKQTTIERIVLEADEGKIITDGEMYGKIVYPSAGTDINTFYEITEEEYEEIERLKDEKINEIEPE